MAIVEEGVHKCSLYPVFANFLLEFVFFSSNDPFNFFTSFHQHKSWHCRHIKFFSNILENIRNAAS